MSLYPVLILTGVVILGVFTGFGISRFNTAGSDQTAAPTATVINTATEVGSTDTKTFRDWAVGVLEKDGLNGEGTHHLTRPGGPSQTVYLISSIIDLDAFVGKKAEVFGETVKAQKAGWLMDVGRIKIVE